MPVPIKGECSIEEMAPEDLLSAVRTVVPGEETGILYQPIGVGYERFLGFAVEDISQAAGVTVSADRDRHVTNALMSARRSLSCLVDQYLLRDALSYVKNPPTEAREKAAILVARGVFDQLTSDALARAVEKRHFVEHRYELVPFDEAQAVVQTVRATIESLTNIENAYCGPCLFGRIRCGYSTGQRGDTFQFYGWAGPAAILATFADPRWIGVIIPESNRLATVRRVLLRDVTLDQLVEVLDHFEIPDRRGSSSISQPLWSGIAKEAGLIA
jgi:hypothetical protein